MQYRLRPLIDSTGIKYYAQIKLHWFSPWKDECTVTGSMAGTITKLRVFNSISVARLEIHKKYGEHIQNVTYKG